jgi:hypothetical protein
MPMINIAWTGPALGQLAGLHRTQQGIVFIQNHTQNWILTNANGWVLGGVYANYDPPTVTTVTATVALVTPANINVTAITSP